MRSICPLRYVGSKFKLGPDIMRLSPMGWDTYYEVFAGSATVLLNYVPADKLCIMNDLDPSPTGFYRWIKDVPSAVDQISELRERLVPERDHELAIRIIFEQMKHRYRLYGCPLAFFVLDRYALGQYVRHHRHDIASFDPKYFYAGLQPITPEKLLLCRERLQNVQITQQDFREFRTLEGENIFVYYDPPYYLWRYHDDETPIYQLELSYSRHIELAGQLKRARHKFLLTVGTSWLERALYEAKDFQSPFRREPGFRVIERPYRLNGINRSLRPVGSELIVMNYDE